MPTKSPLDPSGRRARARARRAANRALARPVPDADTPSREYTPEEEAFLAACRAYRDRYRRRFLDACEYLYVLKSLGYTR